MVDTGDLVLGQAHRDESAHLAVRADDTECTVAGVYQARRSLGDADQERVEFQPLTDGDHRFQECADTFLCRRDHAHPGADLVQKVVQAHLGKRQSLLLRVQGATAVGITHGSSFPAAVNSAVPSLEAAFRKAWWSAVYRAWSGSRGKVQDAESGKICGLRRRHKGRVSRSRRVFRSWFSESISVPCRRMDSERRT